MSGSFMQPVRCIGGSSFWPCQNVRDVLHDDVSLLLRSSEDTTNYVSYCKEEAGRERRHHHIGFVRFGRSRHEVHLPGTEGEQDVSELMKPYARFQESGNIHAFLALMLTFGKRLDETADREGCYHHRGLVRFEQSRRARHLFSHHELHDV